MVSTLERPGATPRLQSVGVVTCIAVDDTTVAERGGRVEQTLVREGAAVVWRDGPGLVGAFSRVTDALRAALALRTHSPTSRVALCTGETGSRGECGPVAAKAARLRDGADPGSTLLSRLAARLIMDHLPDQRALCERSTGGAEPFYELLSA